MSSVFYMKEGDHQVQLWKEDRPFTCMTSPNSICKWTVLVSGLKVGAAIFQRMTEWVFLDLEGVRFYIHKVIVGSSKAATMNASGTTAWRCARSWIGFGNTKLYWILVSLIFLKTRWSSVDRS